MNKQHKNFRPALLAALLAATVLAGCGKGQDKGGAAEPATDPDLVVVSAEMARNFQVAPLALQMISTERALPGRIDANEQLVTRIGASVTGRVTEVFAEVGARVRAGQ